MKRVITLAATALATLTATLVIASPASAAGSCNQTFGVRETKYETVVQVPALSQSLAGTNCVMSTGSYGSAVYNLQYHLNKCYGPNGDRHVFSPALVLDSSFGTNTKNALKAVQSWLNTNNGESLVVDGVYGKNTRNAMQFWSSSAMDCAWIPTI